MCTFFFTFGRRACVYVRRVSSPQPEPHTTRQTRVLLSASEVAAAVLEGRFKEAKWMQTVAMALLDLVLREREQGIRVQ